ncbi:MAG: tetratricopeptide repeat protein [Alphaproteobacteria bacterium]|nr:tetratricopeptide repeat protein [Alphaproteobacteria bacterium]
MTEHNFLQEVQEDFERKKLEALWGKYGFWIILAAVGIVVSTASSTAYRSWKLDRNRDLTQKLLTANREQPEISKNIDLFEKFADEHKGASQTALAYLRAGSLALNQKDNAKAIAYFNKLSSDEKTDPIFRDLATLLSVQAQMDVGKPTELFERLKPVAADSSAFRYSALEAQGYLSLRAGDKAAAQTIFTRLSQDAQAPKSLAARATDVLRALN